MHDVGHIDREALERKLGLDVPVYVQYGRWIGGILLHGSLGELTAWPFFGRGQDNREIAGNHRAWFVHGNRNRAGDRPAGRHLLGDSPGYRRRLRGALHRHHRPGHAELLAGTDGHDLPGHLVGLGATAGADSFHRRPAGESRGVPHSQPDSGDGHGGRHHADDAHHDAGGAEAGLYPHRLVQGAPGAGRDYQAHHQKCPHPGGQP